MDLLHLANFSSQDELFILGDVIDRNGDGGISLLLWIMQHRNIHLIMGNHEDMMLKCAFLLDDISEAAYMQYDSARMDLLTTWLDNGAEVTLNSLRMLKLRDPHKAYELFRFLSKAKYYKVLRIGSKSFLLTHSGLRHFEPGKPLSSYTKDDFIWNRPLLTDSYFADIFTVFGHTPTAYYGMEYRDRMIMTRTFADIDTGASMGGCPMLLRLNDFTPFYLTEEPDDSSVT